MDSAIAVCYGSWKSPITADIIVASSVSFIGTALGSPTDGDGSGEERVYWLEMRPAEGGRNVLVEASRPRREGVGAALLDSDQSAPWIRRDLLSSDFGIRTRVHEYGGGSFAIAKDTLVFSNFKDQRLWLAWGERPCQPLTPELPLRFADGEIDERRDRWIGVREDHRPKSSSLGLGSPDMTVPAVGAIAAPGAIAPKPHTEPTNTLVAVPLGRRLEGQLEGQLERQWEEFSPGELSEGQILVGGADFYASPRLSPDGEWLAWISWNHPHMPWDSTELWVAPVEADGRLGVARRVAGGGEESVVQPSWSPDGWLYFVSDRSNWWNLYRWNPEKPELPATAVCALAAEFAVPHWVFALPTYAFASAEQIVCTYTQQGVWHLGLLDTTTGKLETLPTPYTEISDIQANAERAVFIAGSPCRPSQVVELDLRQRRLNVLATSSVMQVDERYLSQPEAITFPTSENQMAYGLFYPPSNPDYAAAGLSPSADSSRESDRSGPKARPPLLVKSHGGPTAAAYTGLNWEIQYWTSRGFAVLDVNYRGSTGYGRAYRDALKGQWGIVDVEDCVNGARYLVERGLVDGDRLTIEGGSAGGYTTLCALTFRDVFKAGASRYGVSDLQALLMDTHKFESRYLDSLIGPYQEQAEVYRARSPINHVDRLQCPMIFFQGLEDQVVPPSQTERMVEVLRDKGVPVAYVAFADEQHGFRKAANIKRSLEGELYFYSKIFDFEPADTLEPIEILNL